MRADILAHVRFGKQLVDLDQEERLAIDNDCKSLLTDHEHWFTNRLSEKVLQEVRDFVAGQGGTGPARKGGKTLNLYIDKKHHNADADVIENVLIPEMARIMPSFTQKRTSTGGSKVIRLIFDSEADRRRALDAFTVAKNRGMRYLAGIRTNYVRHRKDLPEHVKVF